MTRCVRTVVGVAGALLVGAVVSVAIAWWAATHRPATMMVSKQHTLKRSRGGEDWIVQESGAWGTRVLLYRNLALVTPIGRAFYGPLAAADLPAWAIDPEPGGCTEQHAFGWPLVCMKWTMDARQDCNYWPVDATRAGLGMVYLPVRPCWLNLIASTVLWGSAAWAVVFALVTWPRARRRRVRLRYGHCPACGYDLQHRMEAGCPECGWRQNEAAS